GATPTFTADQLGTYTVELTVSDGELTDSDVAYVNVTQAVHQPPIAGNDYFQVIWKTSNNVLYVLANDSDPDGTIDPTSITIGTAPMAGASAVPQADGTILYSPKTGFKGTDFFTYWVCDSEVPAACSEAEVLVNVVK
ncbi:MAG TPA: Ig-like domain-containing protein, partial [Candidatus Sulfomarinibacteraceae bacterium]|nr:Ig-like domain-containing protein [Candidatus Sulfomarinibacteraceae bacterium]